MINNFKIYYEESIRNSKYEFNKNSIIDISELLLCLFEYTSIYKARFYLQFDNIELPFLFDGDLTIVFEELPEILQELATNDRIDQEIYFAEQSTEAKLLISKNKDISEVKLVKLGSKMYLRTMEDGKTFTVSSTVFINEWGGFLNKVLDRLLKLNPSLSNDNSFIAYKLALKKIGYCTTKVVFGIKR